MTIGIKNPSSIPGPYSIPLFGIYANFIHFLSDPPGYMNYLHKTYGEIATLTQSRTKYVFVFTPKYNEIVLNNNSLFYSHSIDDLPIRIPRESSLSRLFSGLHQMNGVKHSQQRRLMMPAFHSHRITVYHNHIVALTEQKLSEWQGYKHLDILRETRELALSIAIKTRVGLDPLQEGKILGDLLERWIRTVFSISTTLLPFDIPGFPYRQLLQLSDRLEQEIQIIIQQKREMGVDRGDVLSMLLKAQDLDGTQITDNELIGQTATLFVAGHDITARVLTWTLFLLSQHPLTMADLVDELESKLQGSAPTIEQLGDLPLLERVIKESMRLLPPVMWWSRISQAPFSLGPYALPQGTTVIVSQFVTHRLPEIYQEPHKFLPERWRTIHPSVYEYIPFSAGPRVCMGAASAMMEMKLVLSMILQRYRLTLLPKARIDRWGLMLSAPKQGLPMRVAQQDRSFTKSEVYGNIRKIVDLE